MNAYNHCSDVERAKAVWECDLRRLESVDSALERIRCDKFVRIAWIGAMARSGRIGDAFVFCADSDIR